MRQKQINDAREGQARLFEMFRGFGYDVIVQHRAGLVPTKRHKWPCDCRTRVVLLRVIFPNEVVLDIGDHIDWPEQKETLMILKEVLKEQKISYWLAYTGGRGFHIHIFLIGLGQDVTKGTAKDIVVAKKTRVAFVHWLIEKAGLKLTDDVIDMHPVKAKGGTVKEFGAWNNVDGRYKTLLDDIPDIHPSQELPSMKFPEGLVPFDISWLPLDMSTESIGTEPGTLKENSTAAETYPLSAVNFKTSFGELLSGTKNADKIAPSLHYPDASHNQRLGLIYGLAQINRKQFGGHDLFCALLEFVAENNQWDDYNPTVTEYFVRSILQSIGIVTEGRGK